MPRPKSVKSDKRFFTPKQPPAPIVSFKVSPHGVSGYPTTGIPGAYNDTNATTGIFHRNLGPTSSRYGIQMSGTADALRQNYTQYYASGTPSQNTRSAFTSEPVNEVRTTLRPVALFQTPQNQSVQSGRQPARSSAMGEAQFRGYYDGDMQLQHEIPSLDRNTPRNVQMGDVVSPVPATRVRFSPVPTPRQDNQPSGTINNANLVPGQIPGGQSTLHDINDLHTPQRVATGWSGPGTHPAHGPSPHASFDGSWTLDVLPTPKTQLGLQDLAPAADIPVQTYSGSGPRNTSIYYSRPSGGTRVIYPKTVARVKVNA